MTSYVDILDKVITAIIAAVPPTIMALAAYMKASQTHDLVNSRMSELLEIARKESAAQATLDEKAAQHIRSGEAAITTAKTLPVESKRN